VEFCIGPRSSTRSLELFKDSYWELGDREIGR
jgi:hypothetical protein